MCPSAARATPASRLVTTCISSAATRTASVSQVRREKGGVGGREGGKEGGGFHNFFTHPLPPSFHTDVYILDLNSHQWRHVENSGTVVQGRASHCCCIGPNNRDIYMFGGSGPCWGRTNLGDLCKFDTEKEVARVGGREGGVILLS